MVRGKRIAVFGLPGAFTPTCSAKHARIHQSAGKFRDKKVDEVWCISMTPS
jgi:peroxiredoxin